MILNFFRVSVASLLMVFSFSIFASAQTAPASFPNIKIRNFGQMGERYYRGAQPEIDDYQSLKDLGVNTVIDLRNDPTDYEKGAVEALGMKYVNIPMSGWKTPKDRDVQAFLNLINDPANGTVFVHCKAGIHRTGITAAVYRFTKYGWDYDTAYREMKNYNFTPWMVHHALKSYVKDYARKMDSERAKNASSQSPVVASH
jgi:tyrosine-protein phosphatase SIW14